MNPERPKGRTTSANTEPRQLIMKNKLYLSIAKLAWPKIVRQSLAALAGVFAAHGMAGDVYDLKSLIVAALIWGVTSLLSLVTKNALDEGWREILRKLVEAGVSQGIAAASGWLATSGFDGDPMQTEAVLIWLGNFGLSAASRPDAKPKALGQPQEIPPN